MLIIYVSIFFISSSMIDFIATSEAYRFGRPLTDIAPFTNLLTYLLTVSLSHHNNKVQQSRLNLRPVSLRRLFEMAGAICYRPKTLSDSDPTGQCN